MKRVRIRRGRLEFTAPPPVKQAEPVTQSPRRDGHSALRARDGGLEQFDPHAPAQDLTQPRVRYGNDPSEWIRYVIDGRPVLLEFRIADQRVALFRVDLSNSTRNGNMITVQHPPITANCDRPGRITMHMLGLDGLYLRELSQDHTYMVANGDTFNLAGLRFSIG